MPKKKKKPLKFKDLSPEVQALLEETDETEKKTEEVGHEEEGKN